MRNNKRVDLIVSDEVGKFFRLNGLHECPVDVTQSSTQNLLGRFEFGAMGWHTHLEERRASHLG